jgi:hypothetical protein
MMIEPELVFKQALPAGQGKQLSLLSLYVPSGHVCLEVTQTLKFALRYVFQGH